MSDSKGPPHVSVRDVSISYGSTLAATGLTFQVLPGEFVSLIGPSGCGKSSALRAVGGLMSATSGQVEVLGEPVTAPRPKDLAFVFQDLALFPWRSALRNVELPMHLAGVARRERKARALQTLHQVGLGDSVARFPAQLSGGMRQRVAIARALVSDAPILLLDEPFAALDEQTRLTLGGQLLHLLEEQGKTVLFVTHSLQEAVYLSDRIVVMSPRPATIKETITVPLPRPRVPAMMRSAEFHELQDRLFELLFNDEGAGPTKAAQLSKGAPAWS